MSWTPPAQDGGDPVTAYSVTPYIGFNAQPVTTFTSSATTETVTGLTDGTAYTFTVTATTDAGTGPASSPSTTVTPRTVPGAPTILTVTPGNASATITWTPPSSDGGSAITTYTAVAGDETTPTNGGESCTWTAGPLTCTITGLTNGDSYVFGLSATNGAGTGMTSAIVGPVTPATLPSAPLSVNGVAGDGRWSCRGPRRPKTAATRSPPTASPPTSGSPPSP